MCSVYQRLRGNSLGGCFWPRFCRRPRKPATISGLSEVPCGPDKSWPSLSSIRKALQLHGVQSEGLTLSACQDALVCHYISGNCFENSRHARSAHSPISGNDGLGEVSTCCNISAAFTSHADLTPTVLDIISQSTDISTKSLQRIVLVGI